MSQAKHWLFTINNWDNADEDVLAAVAEQCVYMVYGYEQAPTTATPHLQGYLVFQSSKRFNQVRDLLPRRAHIERRRGTPWECAVYCKKSGLFKEYGTPPTGPGSSCGNAGVFDRFVKWIEAYYTEHNRPPNERDIANAFPLIFVRYGARASQLVAHLCPRPILEEGALRGWQDRLLTRFTSTVPDDRQVQFYVDVDGGRGKSWFQRYMLSQFPDRVQLLSIAKRDDIAHIIDASKDIFLFNVPRTCMEFLSYPILEQLKDRSVISPKYMSTVKILNQVPWVVVFSNEYPDEEKMTRDRYDITVLMGDYN